MLEENRTPFLEQTLRLYYNCILSLSATLEGISPTLTIIVFPLQSRVIYQLGHSTPGLRSSTLNTKLLNR